MIGMETVIKARKQGVKPFAVFVQLVREVTPPADGQHMGHTGVVTVQIADRESLSDLDFRPLVGLKVSLEDHTSQPLRQNSAFAAIKHVKPKRLWMPQYDEKGEMTVAIYDAANEPPTLEEFGL